MRAEVRRPSVKRGDMRIGRLGVVGAGVMGRGITGLAASAGIPVVLLDVAGSEDRDGPARSGLEKALKGKAPDFSDPSRARLVQVGNVEDDLERLGDCDWVIEAIVERPGPKRELFGRLEELLGPETIVSSNTSAIPMEVLVEGRGEAFRQRFLGTHFFNPVRWMHLLELIPTPATDLEVLEVVTRFADRILGKGVVVTRDEAGFIANRLGMQASVEAIRLMQEHDLDIDEVDALTGPLMARSKSAVFRTGDIAGVDILAHAVQGLREGTGEDLTLPRWIHEMVEEGRLGAKTGEGFYRKEDGEILVLDWRTGDYGPRRGELDPELAALQRAPLGDRLRGLVDVESPQGDFARRFLARTFHYTVAHASEMAYGLPAIDRAMEWGYAWEAGPFKQMDALGLERVRGLFAEEGLEDAPLIGPAEEAFYQWSEGPSGASLVLSLDGNREPLEEDAGKITAAALRRRRHILREGEESALLDMGDGVALFEIRSKMGTLGADVIEGLREAVRTVADRGLEGLVVGHDGRSVFSAGANLSEVLEGARSGEWARLEGFIAGFQAAMMGLREAPFPVVAAPFGTTLAGGAELSLHSDRVQAHTELRIGLVEFGVGLVPAGGGTKELLFRFTHALERLAENELEKAVREAFTLIGMATVSGSAAEARSLGFLRDRDRVSPNRDRVLADAKQTVLYLAPDYVAPPPRTIQAVGERGIGNLRVVSFSMREAGRMSEHDALIAEHLAYVLCGGDGAPREVTEQDILDLEREAFLQLLGTEATQKRIAHMLETGKPLRN